MLFTVWSQNSFAQKPLTRIDNNADNYTINPMLQNPNVQNSGNFSPAPVPNRQFAPPQTSKSTSEPGWKPGFFQRYKTFEGNGYSQSSTHEDKIDQKAKPGAGIVLTLPLK